MNPEVLEDLYKRATSKGYSKSIEEFTKLISSNQEVLDDNFDYVKTKGYSKDISQFSKLVGFGEKKNQVVTPSNGEEGLTESITETETTPISSDSLEVTEENKEGVINESELNFEQETDVNLPNELTIEERKNLPYNIRQQLSRENNFTRERLSELNSEKETDKESGFGEYIGTALDVGVSTVSKSIYDTPALIYDGFATITNPIARALGIEEASSEKFAEVFDLKNIPSEIVQKRISEKQKQIQDYNNENGGDALTAIENGNILGAAKMIAGTTAQSIPLMIPAFFSGGTSLGIGIVGASTASTKASQIKEENPEIGVGSRTMNAVTTGILESVLGKLLTGASGAVTKKILANEGSKKGAKIISNSFKELLETSIEKSPVLPLFGEILEESLVSVGEQLTDISTGIKTEFSMREVINSGISAVGMGGTNTVSIYAAKGYVSSKKYKQLKKVNKNLSKLSNQLLSSDLSVDEKTLLEESIQRLKSKANGIVDEANDNVSLLSDNDRKELDDTLLKLDEISVTAFSINSNPKTPIEVKQVLLNELKNQASDLTIKKDKILLKENKDGISKQSTETEVPGDAKVSTKQGTDTEMELQQDGEANGESKLTTENDQEGVTETTDTSNTTTESDTESIEISEDELDSLKGEIDLEEDQGSLDDNIGQKVYRGEQEGNLKVEGQQIIFETNESINELGNKDEVGGELLSSLGISLFPKEGVRTESTSKEGETKAVYLNGKEVTIIGRRRDKKGKSVVRVKEVKTGLERRVKGEQAERILLDFSLQKPNNKTELNLTTEGKEVVKEKVISKEEKRANRAKDKAEFESKKLSEIEEMQRQSDEDVANIEQELLDDITKESSKENRLIVKIGDLDFMVSKKPDGEFTVSQKNVTEYNTKKTIGDNPLSSIEVSEDYNDIGKQRRDKLKVITNLELDNEITSEKSLALREESFKNMKEAEKAFESKENTKSNKKKKYIGVGDKNTRKKAIDAYKELKNSNDNSRIKAAEDLVSEYKEEQSNKLLDALDKAIKATSTKGRAYDATLGIPMSLANSALKIVKAGIKGGMSLSNAIKKAYAYIESKGYDNRQTEFKKFVYNSLSKPKKEVTDSKTEEEVIVNKDQKPNSPNKILGIKPTSKDKAKVEGENTQRKKFWKSWNKAWRESKSDLKGKRKELNERIRDFAKGKKGKISAAQVTAIINKINTVNLDNLLQVDKLIKYTNNVFNNAEFAVKVGIAKKLNESTRKRLNKGKLGSNSDFNNIVSQVLNIPISDISIENIDAYNNFLGKIGKKETVTKLENKLITEAESLYDKIFNPEQEVNEDVEADKKESTDKIVDRINDENVSGEQLVETNADFIESDLDKIDSITLENLIDKLNKVDTSVPDVAKLIDQANSYAENRQTLLNEVKSKSKKVNIKAVNKLSQNDASAFKSLTEEVTATFTGTELMQTEIHIDNINEGFYTHPANKISQKINAIKRSNPMKSVVVKIASAKTKVFNSRTRLAAKIKANTFGKSKGLSMAGQMMRSNPLSVIDNVFGNYKNSTIRDNTFEPLAEKYQQYKAWINKNTDKIDAAEKLIAPSLKESINKSVKRRFQITSFLLAKEYESNDNKRGTSPANEWIDKTITQYLDNPLKSRYSEQDINILKEIASESSVDGIMSSEKILKQMSPKTKQAVSLLQEVYSGLGDIQAYATTIVRGNELDLVNNYVHHKADVVKDKVDIQLQSQFELFQAGTKSKTSITRTKGAKSIDFDPISTILRGVRATGLDYFLTNEIQTGRQTLKKLQLDVKKDSEKKLVVQSVIDLEAVYNEALENVVQANFSTDVVGGKYLDAARRIGYYATLASVPRAASEFASNLTYSIISDPVSTVLGMTKYSNLGLGQRGLSFAENVKSTTVSKMWNDEILGGSKASQQGVVRGKKVSKSAKSGLGQGLEYAGRFPKVWGKGTEVLANTLLSTPDKMISRPLFFGSFAKTFKDITGVEMDVDKISENDLEYMAKYEDAIKQSKIQADKSVTRAATSNDPFSGILKNQMKDGETRGNTWRTINAYMSRFSINEYATSRQAIASMVGQGEMTVLQGAATMTAVLARMSMYVVLYKFMQNFAYGLMGAGNDDDDTDYESLGIRQTVGAATSLITRGTTGNIGMMPVNLGIEMLNKEYGYEFGLREDKVYDPFKHSLVYSQISQDQIDRNPYKQIVLTGLGPLAPQFKSLSYLTDKSYKGLFSKTKEGRRKAIDELLSARAAVELFNIPGAMPFYKDIRGALVKEQYKDYGKETGTPSMSTLKKYDIDTYNLIKKQEAEFKNSSEYKAMERERKKFKQSLKN